MYLKIPKQWPCYHEKLSNRGRYGIYVVISHLSLVFICLPRVYVSCEELFASFYYLLLILQSSSSLFQYMLLWYVFRITVQILPPLWESCNCKKRLPCTSVPVLGLWTWIVEAYSFLPFVFLCSVQKKVLTMLLKSSMLVFTYASFWFSNRAWSETY
jgi:hypothetical protein